MKGAWGNWDDDNVLNLDGSLGWFALDYKIIPQSQLVAFIISNMPLKFKEKNTLEPLIFRKSKYK